MSAFCWRRKNMAGISEKQQTDFTIDILASMVIYELAFESGKKTEDVFKEFYASKTCKALYDESSKIWWNGPSYIVDMYKEELASNKVKH